MSLTAVHLQQEERMAGEMGMQGRGWMGGCGVQQAIQVSD
jgi:hypothetical protein